MATCNNSLSHDYDSGKGKSTSLRKMECLKCKIVVFPPVMQCKFWHSVCNFCREKLDKCPDPDCGESIQSAIRSSIAEKFLEKHVVRCKYFKDGTGCMEARMKEEADLLQTHETICHFREVKCFVPGCYKLVRFTNLADHFDRTHCIRQFPAENMEINTSQMILSKEILNENCGDSSFKTALLYAVFQGSIFLAIFRMNSLRMPVFAISSIIHPYYAHPSHLNYRCKVNARNEEDSEAYFTWCGPVSQTFPLTPMLNVRDEFAKLKWIVSFEIFSGGLIH